MVFVATVIWNDLPNEARLRLDAANASVSIVARFLSISLQRTRLISEETFTFKGLMNRLFGIVARGAIRRAHRRHMEAFKRFAERRG